MSTPEDLAIRNAEAIRIAGSFGVRWRDMFSPPLLTEVCWAPGFERITVLVEYAGRDRDDGVNPTHSYRHCLAYDGPDKVEARRVCAAYLAMWEYQQED